MNLHGLLCYCRQGFEPELAAELGERAAAAGIAGYARANRDDGHVLFVTGDQADAQALMRALPFSGLVFARQKLRLFAELRGMDPGDRLTPFWRPSPTACASVTCGSSIRIRMPASRCRRWRAASVTRCGQRCARPDC